MADRDPVTRTRTRTRDRARPQSAGTSDLMLIGTVTTPQGARALLRQDGAVRHVTVGDTVNALTVTAIADDAIYLAQGSRQTVLHIPG